MVTDLSAEEDDRSPRTSANAIIYQRGFSVKIAISLLIDSFRNNVMLLFCVVRSIYEGLALNMDFSSTLRLENHLTLILS